MAPLSILIVGCGVAGPTLASFLLSTSEPVGEKPHITVLERSSSLRAQGQNVDIRGAGVTIIRKLGLESVIRASVTGEEGVRFVDENNVTWGMFAADKSGKIQTGTSDIEILRGERDGGKGIEYVFGDWVEELEQDGSKVNVRFAKSGERRSFDLVVGADGLLSRTRRMVWGEESEEDRVKWLGMYGGFFSCPKGETDSLWRRWFRAPGRKGIMVRPSDRKDRTTVFMLVINDEDKRLRDVALKGHKAVEAQKALLEEHFRDMGWECGRIVKEMKAAEDFYYSPVAQIKMDKWSKGRVVLLGDAGYCASPVSGMGTTLAFTGAYNLAGALARHPDDYTAAFAEYEKQMRPIADRAQKLALGGRGPKALHPETAWGILVMQTIIFIISWSGLANLIFMLAGPPANSVPVEDYGFKDLPEWHEQNNSIARS
ncbi:hypothetical protein H2203_001319 [Taxawa tesnikishii (nom. ined.)]|nr:hypothetical protein H2203_001319 [Dothideales sp. JES 119]